MKKWILTLVIFLGATRLTYAAAGYAYDGLLFLMTVVAFLSVIVLILFLSDYLKKNFRPLVRRVVHAGRHLIVALREMLNREKKFVSA